MRSFAFLFENLQSFFVLTNFTSHQLLFSDGCSAVRYAAANDHSLCIETLVKLKADVNIRSTDGKSPLDRAKEKGHTMCIAALEAAGAT